jgi:two-component system, LytTR family, response regulator
MIKSIIIDDEEDSRKTLNILLGSYFPEIKISRICDSAAEGLEAIKSIQPDLVFLDIQMPQMSGFDLLKQASPVSFEVIFITAHDQYAIKAIRFSALDYLLKPIDVDDLRNAIDRAKERLTQKNSLQNYQSVIQNVQHKDGKIEKLAVPTFEGIAFFNTDEIIYCKAEGSYTNLILKGKPEKLISRNLKDFENILANSGFCRVHHSYLINLKHVEKYIRGEGGYVMMTDNHHVDISRRRKDEFLNMLARL